MRKTAFLFGLIFLAGIIVTFILQDVLVGLNILNGFQSLLFIIPQAIFVFLLFLVIWELYNS